MLFTEVKLEADPFLKSSKFYSFIFLNTLYRNQDRLFCMHNDDNNNIFLGIIPLNPTQFFTTQRAVRWLAPNLSISYKRLLYAQRGPIDQPIRPSWFYWHQ